MELKQGQDRKLCLCRPDASHSGSVAQHRSPWQSPGQPLWQLWSCPAPSLKQGHSRPTGHRGWGLHSGEPHPSVSFAEAEVGSVLGVPRSSGLQAVLPSAPPHPHNALWSHLTQLSRSLSALFPWELRTGYGGFLTLQCPGTWVLLPVRVPFPVGNCGVHGISGPRSPDLFGTRLEERRRGDTRDTGGEHGPSLEAANAVTSGWLGWGSDRDSP